MKKLKLRKEVKEWIKAFVLGPFVIGFCYYTCLLMAVLMTIIFG